METKKLKKLELNGKRFDFFLIGLVTSVGVVLWAFSWTTFKPIYQLPDEEEWIDTLEFIDVTIDFPVLKPYNPNIASNVLAPELNFSESELTLSEGEITQKASFDFDDLWMINGANELNETGEDFYMDTAVKFPKFKNENYNSFLDFVEKQIRYPVFAREMGVEGIVEIGFTIAKNGEITNIQVLGGKRNYGFEEEAVRLIKLSNGQWQPASQNGRLVSFRFKMPFNFQIKNTLN